LNSKFEKVSSIRVRDRENDVIGPITAVFSTKAAAAGRVLEVVANSITVDQRMAELMAADPSANVGPPTSTSRIVVCSYGDARKALDAGVKLNTGGFELIVLHEDQASIDTAKGLKAAIPLAKILEISLQPSPNPGMIDVDIDMDSADLQSIDDPIPSPRS
jgi:hypothetical protein